MSIVVTHPGLQHSHQLAWALYDRGLLQGFWSGIPVLGSGEDPPFWMPNSFSSKLKVVGIPQYLRHNPLVFQALIRSGSQLRHGMSTDDFTHKIFHLYDWWFSRKLPQLRPNVVVAYENSAYHTFKAARAIGARCVLDAASFHHSVGTKSMVTQLTQFREVINRRKDAEVELADRVITCSPLAADSYREAGVSDSKLCPMLLGAELPDVMHAWKPHNGPLQYCFAGGLSYRKSIDVILDVFRRLCAENHSVRVSFIGGVAEKQWLGEIEKTPNADYHPNMPQPELFEMLAKADCLLLPSRFDSFGMVVAESMACGTPAIVSTLTGAKAMIEQFPGAGWIVEPDAESLYGCILRHIENRQLLFAAREQALAAAEHFTWQAYRQRAGNLFQAFVESW